MLFNPLKNIQRRTLEDYKRSYNAQAIDVDVHRRNESSESDGNCIEKANKRTKIQKLRKSKKAKLSDKSNPSQSELNEISIADDISLKPRGSKGHNSTKFSANPSQSELNEILIADDSSRKPRGTKGQFISISKKKQKCK